jgi:nucleotide-binding universal stress UspA family protein
VLFHVFDPVPECYWDLENDSHMAHMVGQLKSWEDQKRKNIRMFMENATELLVGNGFDRSSIEIKIKDRQEGIARDIIKEAGTGYDAVMLRRRGVSALESIVVGSVANKLLSKLTNIPLIIGGQIAPVRKTLLAIDGSESSWRVVDTVCRFLAGDSHEIQLFNVIRGLNPWVPELPDAMIQDRFELAREEITVLFAELKEKLVAAGFDPAKVSEKIITGEFSRAGAIVREATNNGFGAIVVGRRGISKVEEFFLGRVSSKVIHSGRNHTVWVV